MTITTYSLEEAAAVIVGVDGDGNLLPGAVEWLRRRLVNGVLPGFKAARRWRMTEQHIADALRSLEPEPVGVPDLPSVGGMTRTSQRRLAG